VPAHPAHAGFAVVIEIGGRSLQRMLRALYADGLITHRFPVSLSLPVPGGGTVTIDGTLFLDVPQLTLAGSDADRMHIDLRCWGTLTARNASGASATGSVMMTASVLVSPAVTLTPDDAGPTLSFGLDASGAAFSAGPTLTVIGGSLGPAVDAFLSDPAVVSALQDLFLTQLAATPRAPIPLSFLGDLVLAPVKTVSIRVLDDVLAIAIDVTWDVIVAGLVPVYPAPVHNTAGDRAALADFRDGQDMAYVVNPSQVPIVFAAVTSTLRDQLPSDVTIDTFTLTVTDGALHVTGTAHAAEGSADFSFDVVPHLSQEEFQTWKEKLTFTLEHVDVDVHPAGWITAIQVFFGILTLGVLALGIDRIIDALRGNLVHQLAGQSPTAGDRNQQFFLGDGGPLVDLRIQTFRIERDGILSTLRVRPRLGKPRITGTSRIFTDGTAVRAQVHYAITVPADLLISDPLLRVAWQLRRLDSNITVDSVDAQIATAKSYRADVTLAGATDPPPMSLTCRLYRTLGSATENRFNQTVTLRATDPIDRRHPFVHWHAVVPLPSFVPGPDGALHKNGIPSVERTSKIHRTDLPWRCLFADQFSPDVTPVYLDQLPFPVTDLAGQRHRVCDYCFFGGPDKSVPLPLPAAAAPASATPPSAGPPSANPPAATPGSTPAPAPGSPPKHLPPAHLPRVPKPLPDPHHLPPRLQTPLDHLHLHPPLR
jgi:hypothetical protein